MNNKPWLIQTAEFRNPVLDGSVKEGIDRFLKFNYMGSAEFEYGALGTSLKRIRTNIKDYDKVICMEYPIDKSSRFIYLFFPRSTYTQEGLVQILNDLYNGKTRLKEYDAFKEATDGVKDVWSTEFWWDIDNDWMVWIGTDHYETKCSTFIHELKGA